MYFTEREINLATRLRGAGLTWDPAPGHYAFDVNGAARTPSPIQAGVYLIHSTNVFETMLGGREELLNSFVWLPTWWDARDWLETRGVADETVKEAWVRGLDEDRTDREILYRLMLAQLDIDAEAST